MEKLNILLAEHTHYDSLFQVGCHHIAKELAKRGHSVTYISTCVSPLHFLSFFTKDRSEIPKRFSNYMKGGVRFSQNIFTYVPFSLIPIIKNPLTDNKYIAGRYLDFTLPNIYKWLAEREPFDVAFFGEPKFAPLMKRVTAEKKIFRLTDFVLAFKNAASVHEFFIEEGLKHCDDIVVTSKPLQKFLKDRTSKPLHYVPNGVDIDHFLDTRHQEPLPLKKIPLPRAIYVGAIEQWFDVELLNFLANEMPALQILIIGPPKINLHQLYAHKNIHILGPKPWEDIPAYLQRCHVGIIPFKKGPLVDGISPIKMYEYMACGLPVVATAWKELEEIDSPAGLAYSQSQFVDMVRELLARKDDPRYLSFALESSWEKRVTTLLNITLSAK